MFTENHLVVEIATVSLHNVEKNLQIYNFIFILKYKLYNAFF